MHRRIDPFVQDADNLDRVLPDAVDDNVPLDREVTASGAEIVAERAEFWERRDRVDCGIERVLIAVCLLPTPRFGTVKEDVVVVGASFGRERNRTPTGRHRGSASRHRRRDEMQSGAAPSAILG